MIRISTTSPMIESVHVTPESVPKIGVKSLWIVTITPETEYVKESLNECALISGFYSYGQIAPFNGNDYTNLHNQTMTVTLISE